MKLKSETVYAAECLKLLIKIENEFFDTLYNTDAEINIMIRIVVNTVKLSIWSDSIINLIVYDNRKCSFIKACLNIKINCKEVKYYTLTFIVKKQFIIFFLKDLIK